MRRFLAVLCTTSLLSALLVACGGGGSDPAPAPDTGGVPASSFNTRLQGVSYDNFKAIGLQPARLHPSTRYGTIRAYGDFFGDGRAGLFAARLLYAPGNSTPGTATPAAFEFWRRNDDGNFVRDDLKITGGTGCIHPRKAVVADFNRDGRPDVVVACHGWDAAPFPGERMKLLLSDSAGRYRITDAAPDIGYFHNAVAGDIDGDGWVDLIAVNNFDSASAIVFLNQRDGSFRRDSAARMPAAIANRQYFTVELLDVDGDGHADLFFGGHEWERNSATVVLRNPGSGDFRNVTPTVIPAVPGDGVVLDVTVTGSGNTRALWVVRTSGGDGTFYIGRTVQRVAWPGLNSTLAYANRSTPWTTWLIPAPVAGVPSLVHDDIEDGIVIAQ